VVLQVEQKDVEFFPFECLLVCEEFSLVFPAELRGAVTSVSLPA
jgi:hypothetical protein